nr:gluconate 2-dehydrogenase subunit 3 family protein [Burkholderiaceae bacterium]
DTHVPMLTPAARFSDAHKAMLDRLCDLMIPASPDGRMPAASSLDLYADPGLLSQADRAVLESGLTQIAERAQAQHGLSVVQLSDAQAMPLIEAMRAEGSAFVQVFTVQTAGRYLMHPTVLPLIGLPARPHWPQGHAVDEGDWSLIDVVRQRPKLYRKV